MDGGSSSRVARWAPTAWATVLALLLLGPALGRGFVLSYDMVWVPDLALGRDALGTAQALPRAVPSDAVVAVLDELLGGVLLQKVVLVLPLVAAGAGAAALAGRAPVARLVAASVAVWNPFVVERLGIGHWPVLVGYGVLPWLLLAGVAWRRTGVMPARLPLLLVLGSLSATTGLATAVALAAAAGERSARRWWRVAGLAALANLPWLVAGVLHAGSATSSATGADVFAPHGQGRLPGPASFLTLGGIWNAQVVPGSSEGWRGPLLLVLLCGLALVGAVAGRSLVAPGAFGPLVTCWVVGMTVALVTWGVPSVTAWAAGHVPGGGLLRDGSRLLALAAPLTAVLVGLGAAEVCRRLPDVVSRVVIAGACALAPVALIPDAALGLSGGLDAVPYPASYAAAVADLRSQPAGDAALLPFQAYRAPAWNDRRPVLAPLGRYLGRPVVVQDDLVVDGRQVAGEDPRAAEVEAALSRPTPGQRAEALRQAGIRWLVVEDLPGVDVPDVTGTEVWTGDGLRTVDLGPGAPAPAVPVGWRVSMGAAWALWVGLLVVASGRGAARVVRQRRGIRGE